MYTIAKASAENPTQQHARVRYLLRGETFDTATPAFYTTQSILQPYSMWNKEQVVALGPSVQPPSPPSTMRPFIFNNLHQYIATTTTTTEPSLTQTWSGAPIVVDYVGHDYIDDDKQPVQQQQPQQHSNRAQQNFYNAFVQRNHKLLPQQASKDYLPLLPPPFMMHPPPSSNSETRSVIYVRPLKSLNVQQRKAERYAAYASLFERYVRKYPHRLIPKYDIS